LRDRTLIGLMVYFFARIGDALGRTVEEVYTQNRWFWVRLREKGGKRHVMPYPPEFRVIPHQLSELNHSPEEKAGEHPPRRPCRHNA
jgi:integrase